MQRNRLLFMTVTAAVALGVMLALTAPKAQAQADKKDVLFFNSDGITVREPQTGGKVTEENWERVVYAGTRIKRGPAGNALIDPRNGQPIIENYEDVYEPYLVRGIKYGNAPESWLNALTNYLNGEYKTAAEGFQRFLREDATKAIDDLEDLAPTLLYTAYAYAGVSYVRLGQALDRGGIDAFNIIIDSFRLDLSRRARERRNQEYNRDRTKIESTRDLIRKAVSLMVSNMRAAGHRDSPAIVDDYRTRTDDAETAEDLEALVTDFRTLYRAYSADSYMAAETVLMQSLEKNGMLQSEYEWRNTKARTMPDIMLALGDARWGLGRIQDGSGKGALTAWEDNRDLSVAYLVNLMRSRLPKATYYSCEAKRHAASALEEQLDFAAARDRYLDIMDASKRFAEDGDLLFANFFNDANLKYGLVFAKAGNFGSALDHFNGLLKEYFGDSRDPMPKTFQPDYVLDPASASLYAGAMIGLGDIYLDEYRKEGRKENRLRALESYLRVSALFSAGDRTAEALYKAAQLYRELAEDVRNVDPAPGLELPAPYDYYMDNAKQLDEQLHTDFPDSPWASR